MPTFRRKPDELEAHQLTWEDSPAILDWCGGIPWYAGAFLDAIILPDNKGIAYLGDWIVQNDGVFYRMPDRVFRSHFEAVNDLTYPPGLDSTTGSWTHPVDGVWPDNYD